MVVVENPSKEDDQIGYLLTGRPGKMFDTILKQAGLSRKEVYITPLVKCHSKYTKKQAEFCADSWLQTEIKENTPKVIICLGKLAGAVVLDIPKSAATIGLQSSIGPTPVFLTHTMSSLLNKGRKYTDQTVEIFKLGKQT